MQAWFISDIHIKDINERNSILLLRFLRFLEANKAATHLILLGDIFDLWVGDSRLFEKKYAAIVDSIVRLKDRGLQVTYFEGNHDVHIQRFWQQRFGISVFTDFQILNLGPWRVRVEHGDYINPDDLAYIKYLEIIRSKKMQSVAYGTPGFVFDKLGQWASRASRKYSTQYREETGEELRNKIRRFAMKRAEDSQFDYIITGHMHIRDEFRFNLGTEKKISINLGSWFEEPFSLCLDEKNHTWQKVGEL